MLEDILRERNKKLDAYEKTQSAFPASVSKDRIAVCNLLSDFEKISNRGEMVTVAGRIFASRGQGKILFFDIEDDGARIQLVGDEAETEAFSLLRDSLDIGDILEVTGVPFITKRGEQSVKIHSFRLLTKSLRPIPSSWYGIEDPEIKLRKRYLDLLLNQETRELFKKKALFWESIRAFLLRENFLPVETPVLEPIPGGAEAEPFVTHMNALNEDFYLRISLELPLKKLLVGGFPRVFEIGRIFRNEGIDREHLQDYTQMECYAAYQDYEWMMQQVRLLYQEAIQKTFGTLTTAWGETQINWGGEWPKVDYYEIFEKETGIDLKKAKRSDLENFAKKAKIVFEPAASLGRLIDLIFKKTARAKMIQPCFLINPPVLIEPLAKRTTEDKDRVYRFQVMAAGSELGKGFSELNDPRDQRARFEEQMRLRAAGDTEAQMIDESFLEALEYGMPPAAGFGMSERLFAVLADKPIRETSLFPLMRKE